jgi:dihydrodipicolinate synthase/N-acetylneuraminate lyase
MQIARGGAILSEPLATMHRMPLLDEPAVAPSIAKPMPAEPLPSRPNAPLDPLRLIRPRRRITGMSAILLPFAGGSIDWRAFTAHVARTADAGLIPAVNMDTGYVNLLDGATRCDVLEQTASVLTGRPFVAGAFVADSPGDRFDCDAYLRQIDPIVRRGGTPVIFQSHGLTGQDDDGIVASYAELGRSVDQLIGFELGPIFAPFGKIYSLDVYRGLLAVPQCVGAKHSSLRRDLEWDRLALRDAVRPDFQVLTGNDLAIDMVMYGSDYLLGLSTFAPDLFAKRDAMWAAGDPAFYELNDVLQYLGFFAFRAPVPAYKHSAAMFLHLRNWIASDTTHPQSPTRSASDRPILREIGRQLNIAMSGD